jgi:hypothetical protein
MVFLSGYATNDPHHMSDGKHTEGFSMRLRAQKRGNINCNLDLVG